MTRSERVQFVSNFVREHKFNPQDWRKIHDAIVLIEPEIEMSDVISGATKVLTGTVNVPKSRKSRIAAATKGDCIEFATYVSKKGGRFIEADKRLILDILKAKWKVC